MNREPGLRARARALRGVVAVALATAVSPLVVGPLTAHADTLSTGDVLVGTVGGRIAHYDPHGKLLNVLDTSTVSATAAPNLEAGMCFDPAQDVYTTNFNASSMTELNSQGSIVHNPWVSGFNTHPESCVEDASGNTFVGSVAPGDLRKISPGESLLATYTPTVEKDGIDWVDLASDQCTIYYTSAGSNIFRYNTCTSTQLSDFADNVSANCAALRIRAGGDVLLACPDPIGGSGAGVYHLDATGKVIQVYSAASFNQVEPFALDLDPDGMSFWVGDETTGTLDKIDVETGRVLVQVQTGVSNLGGIAVVPGPRPAAPPVAASLPPVQTEFVVCGDAPVTGLPSASSTPCVRSLTGTVVQQTSSVTGQAATVTGAANAFTANGAFTVAGRGAPPNASLQVQYVPSGVSAQCGLSFWSSSNPPPGGAVWFPSLTADQNGNYASAGALTLPNPTAAGTAQICVVSPPPPGTSTPLAQQTVPVTIVTGDGTKATCLQSSPSHNTFTSSTAADGAWWNGDPGANGPTGGVYAKISNYNPSVTKGTGEVTASTMLYTVPPTPLGAVQTAQTGWTKGDLHFPPGTPPQQFAEYVDTTVGVDVFFSGVSGAIPTVQVPGAPSVPPSPPSPPSPPGTVQLANGLGTAVVGDSDYYATLFDPTTNLVNAVGHFAPGEFNFYVDNTLVASIPGTFAPADTRVGTTVATGTDQIAGGVSNPEHFSDAWAYAHGWHSFDAQTVTPVVTKDVATYASMSATNPAAGATVNTWDTSCSM